jgi:hypothetical protein
MLWMILDSSGVVSPRLIVFDPPYNGYHGMSPVNVRPAGGVLCTGLRCMTCPVLDDVHHKDAHGSNCPIDLSSLVCSHLACDVVSFAASGESRLYFARHLMHRHHPRTYGGWLVFPITVIHLCVCQHMKFHWHWNGASSVACICTHEWFFASGELCAHVMCEVNAVTVLGSSFCPNICE